MVKKHYADKALRNRKRKWKLKHMAGFPHVDTQSCNDEYEDFAVREGVRKTFKETYPLSGGGG